MFITKTSKLNIRIIYVKLDGKEMGGRLPERDILAET